MIKWVLEYQANIIHKFIHKHMISAQKLMWLDVSCKYSWWDFIMIRLNDLSGGRHEEGWELEDIIEV